jgi:hypothetical protein
MRAEPRVDIRDVAPPAEYYKRITGTRSDRTRARAWADHSHSDHDHRLLIYSAVEEKGATTVILL